MLAATGSIYSERDDRESHSSPTRVPLVLSSPAVTGSIHFGRKSSESHSSPTRVPLESHSAAATGSIYSERDDIGRPLTLREIGKRFAPQPRFFSCLFPSLFFFLPFFFLFSFFFPFLFFSFFLSPFFSHLVRQAKTTFCFKEVVNWFCSKGTSSLLSVCSFLHFSFHAVSSGCSLLISFTSACLVDVVCFGKSTIYFIISFLQSTTFFSGLLTKN